MAQETDKEYKIEVISEEFSDKIIEFLKAHFIGYDPITEYLLENNVNISQFLNASYYEYNKKVIREGYSVMAVANSGDIVGLLINEKLENELVSTNPELKLLIGGLNTKMNETVKCEKEILIRIAAVHPKFNKKGIGKALVLKTIETAKQKGFEQIRIHCTSAYSAKLCESIGFKYIQSVAYEDFKINGVVYFKPKLPHTHVHGMVFQLCK